MLEGGVICFNYFRRLLQLINLGFTHWLRTRGPAPTSIGAARLVGLRVPLYSQPELMMSIFPGPVGLCPQDPSAEAVRSAPGEILHESDGVAQKTRDDIVLQKQQMQKHSHIGAVRQEAGYVWAVKYSKTPSRKTDTLPVPLSENFKQTTPASQSVWRCAEMDFILNRRARPGRTTAELFPDQWVRCSRRAEKKRVAVSSGARGRSELTLSTFT